MSAAAPTPRWPRSDRPSSFAGCGAGHDRDLVQRTRAHRPRSALIAAASGCIVIELLVAEAAVHQQADQMRVAGEGRAVRVVGGQEDAPRVIDAQEDFQTDGPLQRIDEVLVLVLERAPRRSRHRTRCPSPPTCFGLAWPGVAVLHHVVAGAVTVWPNRIWPTSALTLGCVDRLGHARGADENLRSPSVP
jgi:hypothetical protein